MESKTILHFILFSLFIEIINFSSSFPGKEKVFISNQEKSIVSEIVCNLCTLNYFSRYDCNLRSIKNYEHYFGRNKSIL